MKQITQRAGAGVHESCLVDTWVGQGRYLWVDLTAGPFQWGPVMGGTGLRDVHSLPSMQRLFGHLPNSTGSKSNLDEELERMADERFQVRLRTSSAPQPWG